MTKLDDPLDRAMALSRSGSGVNSAFFSAFKSGMKTTNMLKIINNFAASVIAHVEKSTTSVFGAKERLSFSVEFTLLFNNS